MEVSYALGAEVLLATGAAASLEEGARLLERTITTGAAREQFARMVRAQGGDVDSPRLIAPASEFLARRPGYLASIDAELFGKAIIAMGGGRQQLADKLDHSTGIEMLTRLGERVDEGQPLLRVFANRGASANAQQILESAITIADHPVSLGPLILDRIT
jgi:thymidine phosphorylase